MMIKHLENSSASFKKKKVLIFAFSKIVLVSLIEILPE